MSAKSPFSQSASSLFPVLLLICLALYSAGAISTGFTGTDELRYAEVAKEMDSFGHLFYLRYQGNPYPDKPPLFFWMVKLGYVLHGGPAPWALRAPLIICTLLTVLLTYGIGRALFDKPTALLGAAFYGLSFRVTWSAHLARLDPPLVLFTTLALYCFARQLANVEAGRRPPVGNVLAFWAAMALGFLIKGPLALLVPLMTVALYRLFRRRWKGAAGWSTLAGFVLFFTMILCLWILPGAWFGRHVQYFQTVVGQEVVERSATPWRHVKEGLIDPVYYFGRLAAEFVPGSLFLPGVICLWFVFWRKRRLSPDMIFLWCWFAGVFVFFTLMRSKRGQYILPLYPAAGLLVGHFIVTLFREGVVGRRWFWRPVWLLSATALVFAVLVHVPPFLDFLGGKIGGSPDLDARLVWSIALIACFLGMMYYNRKREAGRMLIFVLAVIPSLIIPGFLFYFPDVYDDTNSKRITAVIEEYARPGDRVFMHRSEPQWAIYGDFYMSEFDTAEGARHLGVPTVVTQTVSDGESGETEERTVPKTTHVLRIDSIEAFFASEEPLLALLSGVEYAEMPMQFPGARPYLLEVLPLAMGGKNGGSRLVSNRPAHEWRAMNR